MKLLLLFFFVLCIGSCRSLQQHEGVNDSSELQFDAANGELVEAFKWAKQKALSYAHDGSDPVGYWYEAALPNREAFCMRDVSHQAIGAEILGLGKHNYNMFLKFAQNIDEEMDYCSYWEINRYNNPAPVDYETDKDFWYNLPANFDITYSAYRLYKWTGNMEYIESPEFNNFYELSLNEFVNHWDLGSDEILGRNRSMHVMEDLESSRFGDKRGIPTYNEGGRGATLIGIDMTASIIAAYNAYAEMLKIKGDIDKANGFKEKAKVEQEFLESFWWDTEKNEFRSILYEDKTFDHFMVGDDQAFLHYLLYFDAISDPHKIQSIVKKYETNFDKLIVELKSYLPILFYEYSQYELANKMIIDLCHSDNLRRDYPENSFTVIEHLTRGLMGVEVDASINTFSTVSRISDKDDWATMSNIPLLSNKISVRHYGQSKTIVANETGELVNWSAQFSGTYDYLYINGKRTDCHTMDSSGHPYSYAIISLDKGDNVTVSTHR